MLLKDFLEELGIQGIPYEKLREILTRNNPGFSYDILTLGSIRINYTGEKSKYLKCVKEYYTLNPDGKKIAVGKHTSAFGDCAEVCHILSIDSSSRKHCDACHYDCLQMLKDKKLYRVKKAYAKKRFMTKKNKESRLPW